MSGCPECAHDLHDPDECEEGKPMTTTEPSEQHHTGEPWIQSGASKSLHARKFQRLIVTGDYEYVIAELMQFGEVDAREANARRIVACVNACKDWPTESLEAFVSHAASPSLPAALTAEINRGIEQDRALAERDRRIAVLVAALEELRSAVLSEKVTCHECGTSITRSRGVQDAMTATRAALDGAT